MIKPRITISATGMPREDLAKIQRELDDTGDSKYLWIFDNSTEYDKRGNEKIPSLYSVVAKVLDLKEAGYSQDEIESVLMSAFNANKRTMALIQLKRVDYND